MTASDPPAGWSGGRPFARGSFGALPMTLAIGLLLFNATNWACATTQTGWFCWGLATVLALVNAGCQLVSDYARWRERRAGR